MSRFIEIKNKQRKTVINSDFNNFVCQPIKTCQLKRMPGTAVGNLLAFSSSDNNPRGAYLSITQFDTGTVLAAAVFSPYLYFLPPVVTASLPAGYNIEVSYPAKNRGNQNKAAPNFYYTIRVRKNDGSSISVDEVKSNLDLYVYDFLWRPAYPAGEMVLNRANPIGSTHSWSPLISIHADEGTGATYFGDTPKNTMEYPVPLYKRERDKYPGINTRKVGLQIFGWHRHWKETYHSPKKDPRTEEEKKKKKDPMYSRDLLFDSRLPYMYVIGDVTKSIAGYTGAYRKGDIVKLHQEGTIYRANKVAVCISSLINGTVSDVVAGQYGYPTYKVAQRVAFYAPNSVGTVETEDVQPAVTPYPGGFYGAGVTNYLIVNVDGVQPNTVDEFV